MSAPYGQDGRLKRPGKGWSDEARLVDDGRFRGSQLAITRIIQHKTKNPPPSPLVSSAMAATMTQIEQVNVNVADGGLSKALELNKVHADLIQLVKDEGVENLMEFSSYFSKEKYEEEATEFCGKVQAVQGKKVEVARFRNAIILARAVIDRPPSKVEPAGVQDMEAPLDALEKEMLAKSWTARYGVRLDMFLDPADPLVNRLFREFRANTPTLIPVSRIRSVYTDNNPHPEKRVTLTGGVSITVSGNDDTEVVRDVAGYCFSLRILANASAKAGNYEVESKVEKEGKVVFAPLDINMQYADHAFRMALKQPGNGVRWLEDRDLHTRGLMINLMRGGMPQGEALSKAIKEDEMRWNSLGQGSHQETGRRARSRSPRGPPRVPKKPLKKPLLGRLQQQSIGKGSGGKGKAYASMLKGGKKICRSFNMGNCTEGKCPYGGLHVCNAVENGRTCGGKHPSVRHTFTQGR